MKYFFDHLQELEAIFCGPTIVFFDFDMTLAPVATNPKDASVSLSMRQALIGLSSRIPIGIISGRSLDDILARIHIPGAMYAGNHGAEWSIAGQRYVIPFDESSLFEARKKLIELAGRYPQDTFLEDKKYTIAFHYRMARLHMIPLIEEGLRALSLDERIAVRWSKMTFEVRPIDGGNKGSVCLTMMKAINPLALPVYIGDDLTDEDAFKALTHGITIRVGQSDTSNAHYYLKDQKEIDEFLRFLLKHVKGSPKSTYE